MRGHRDEFLEATAEMDDAPDHEDAAEPKWPTASSHGAGALGFTGTAPAGTGAPAGMAHLTADGTNSTLPLLPATWPTDADATPGRR